MYAFMQRCLHLAGCALRVFLFFLNNIYCIPGHVTLMLLLRPLLWTVPSLYWRIEGVCFNSLLHMVAMLSYTANYELMEMGDDIDRLEEQKCLFLINHQSTGDVPMLMNMLTARRNVANNAMWIMDMIFKWTNFGFVSQAHRDFFIECGKKKRDRSVEELRRALVTDYIDLDRKWLLLFPEGGFLHKRKEVSQRFAKKSDLPHLERVTLPRVGAAKAVLDTLAAPSDCTTAPSDCTAAPSDCTTATSNCTTAPSNCTTAPSDCTAAPSVSSVHSGATVASSGHIVSNGHHHGGGDDGVTSRCPNGSAVSNGVGRMAFAAVPARSSHIQWVVDLTIAYPVQDRPLGLLSITAGSHPPCTVIFHYRVFPIHQVPRDTDGLTDWLYRLFYDKERALNEYYASGRFPTHAPQTPPRRVRHDPLAWMLRHVFFLASTWFQYRLFSALLALVLPSIMT